MYAAHLSYYLENCVSLNKVAKRMKKWVQEFVGSLLKEFKSEKPMYTKKTMSMFMVKRPCVAAIPAETSMPQPQFHQEEKFTC